MGNGKQGKENETPPVGLNTFFLALLFAFRAKESVLRLFDPPSVRANEMRPAVALGPCASLSLCSVIHLAWDK